MRNYVLVLGIFTLFSIINASENAEDPVDDPIFELFGNRIIDGSRRIWAPRPIPLCDVPLKTRSTSVVADHFTEMLSPIEEEGCSEATLNRPKAPSPNDVDLSGEVILSDNRDVIDLPLDRIEPNTSKTFSTLASIKNYIAQLFMRLFGRIRSTT